MIYKFQPFSVTKELGKEYNAHCAIVPKDDDWILILDYDCCIINPVVYTVINTAIATYPDTEIFGAMTNRVNYARQRISPFMGDNFDMKYHFNKAAEVAAQYPKECDDTPTVAGFFLLFRKAYWNKCKFQDKIINSDLTLFDYHFCQKARKIRIIKGAYVFHGYRIWKKDWRGQDHLMRK